jgi:mercuric ion transport protein
MSDLAGKASVAERPAAGSGAALFTIAGLAAAFGLASCCALPLLLTTVGVSTAWLAGVALMAAPHREALLAVGTLCLLGGAALLWRQQRATATCGASGVHTPPVIRALTLAGLLVGGALLWAGYTYV